MYHSKGQLLVHCKVGYNANFPCQKRLLLHDLGKCVQIHTSQNHVVETGVEFVHTYAVHSDIFWFHLNDVKDWRILWTFLLRRRKFCFDFYLRPRRFTDHRTWTLLQVKSNLSSLFKLYLKVERNCCFMQEMPRNALL